MKDEDIIELYQKRSEQAIVETERKYGAYCGTIAGRILQDGEDCKECLNDTWLKTWETIPPVIPKIFSAYIGKITRNLALNMYKKRYAGKRISERMMVSMEELQDCVSDKESVESKIEEKIIIEKLNEYLGQVAEMERKIFVRRYFYLDTMREIADLYDMKESYVKTLLFRTRKRMKEYFQKEGIIL